LIIHGDRDIVSRLDPCATELEEFIPNAKLKVLKDVNHFPQVEAPELDLSIFIGQLKYMTNGPIRSIIFCSFKKVYFYS